MTDEYRECSVCSALLTGDEVWAEDSGSIVFATSSLDSLDVPLVGQHESLNFRSPHESLNSGGGAGYALNGALCEHCYVQQEAAEFSGSYDFLDADELDPWAMFDE